MTNKFNIIVKKFGGSSVASPTKISEVASFIQASLASKQEPDTEQALSKEQRVCVVVSAMGHTTNELISLAHAVNPHPPKRELDMLTSCGERSSMALLAMALDKIGVKAISLTGSQSGIITDDCHSGAEIIAIRPQRVLEAFLNYQVVIIAGFQGVSRNREITTLKRGGSDTTAVAMAAALKARSCEIYTDVNGVMDIDPRLSKHAQLIPELSHRELSSMSLYGAKIMAHDAALIAEGLGVNLLIAQSCSYEPGTTVPGEQAHEIAIKTPDKLVKAISHLRGIVKIRLDSAASLNSGSYLLCASWQDGAWIAYASNDIAQELSSDRPLAAGLALITLQLADRSRIFELLALTKSIENLALLDGLLGYHEIFLIVKDSQLNQALAKLHEALSYS